MLGLQQKRADEAEANALLGALILSNHEKEKLALKEYQAQENSCAMKIHKYINEGGDWKGQVGKGMEDGQEKPMDDTLHQSDFEKGIEKFYDCTSYSAMD